MNEEKAIKYLKRKNIETTQDEIEKVMKKGSIYGDPTAEVEF